MKYCCSGFVISLSTVASAIQDEIAAQDDLINALREFKRSAMARLFTYGADEVPAETKMTEVGEIPVGWEVVELSRIAQTLTSTSTLRTANKYSSEFGVELLYLKVSDMNFSPNRRHIVMSNVSLRVPPQAIERLKTVPLDSIIFPKRGAAIRTNKKRIVKKHSLLDPNLIAVSPSVNLLSNYLYYWFLGFDLSSVTDDNTIPQLNKKDVESIRIPLPSIAEQETIALFLSNIDEKTAAEEDRKTALHDFFRSMLQQLMTGQIRLLSDEGLPL